MQVLISSTRFSSTFFTQNGSAKNGRAIDTISALPEANTSSAVSVILIRLEATTGTFTAAFTCAVTSTKAARGTEVTMVGTRASCQPIPVLMIVTPQRSK